jgi:hypothetical protein
VKDLCSAHTAVRRGLVPGQRISSEPRRSWMALNCQAVEHPQFRPRPGAVRAWRAHKSGYKSWCYRSKCHKIPKSILRRITLGWSFHGRTEPLAELRRIVEAGR